VPDAVIETRQSILCSHTHPQGDDRSAEGRLSLTHATRPARASRNTPT